jgi:hypothetical protein
MYSPVCLVLYKPNCTTNKSELNIKYIEMVYNNF